MLMSEDSTISRVVSYYVANAFLAYQSMLDINAE